MAILRPTLDADLVVRSLEAIGHGAGHEHQQQLIRIARARLNVGDRVVDTLGTDLLRSSFSPLRTALRPEIFDRLEATPLFVIDLEICNASAVFAKPDAHILIYRGLIRATIYYLELGEMLVALRALDDTSLAELGSDRSELASLFRDAVWLLGDYIEGNASLPWIGAKLSPTARSSVFIDFTKALWFVAMHELGHIALNHGLTNGTPPPLIATAFAIEEEVDTYKHQEFDADGYVLESLKAEFLLQAGSFILRPLEIIAFLELWLGRSGTHPLSANRLKWFAERLRGLDPTGKAADELAPFITANLANFRAGRAKDIRFEPTGPASRAASVDRLTHLYGGVPQDATASVDLELGMLFARIVSEWWYK